MKDLQSVMNYIRLSNLKIAPEKPEKCATEVLSLCMGEEIVD